MHYGTEMNVSQFGVRKSKVKVMVEQGVLVTRFLGLLTRCLDKY